MLRVGLTGGIGSGKSTVAEYFRKLGIEVIDADNITHSLSQPGTVVFDDIVSHFGQQVVLEDGTLDRDWLRKHVFADTAEKAALEKIIHPAVRSSMEIKLTAVKSPYCVLVVPLLIETGFTDMADRVLIVMASESIRTKRVMQRSGLSEDQIHKIMSTQATDADRLDTADDVIINDGKLDTLQHQVEALDKKYRELADSPL
ncbi:MAG: dephospho-CoA kinase [bacterium]